MRKHKIRHILHGLLDLLPLFVIPVFMVYSHRHEINDYTVDTTETFVTPLYQTNEVNSVNDIEVNKVYFATEFTIDLLSLNSLEDNTLRMDILTCENCVIDSDSYDNSSLDEIDISEYNCNIGNAIEITLTDEYCAISFTNKNAYTSLYFDSEGTIVFYNIDFVLYPNSLDAFKTAVVEFGYGSFDNISSSDFQTYDVQVNLGVVLNDTDIGSQFIYSLYNVTTKYFNTDSVFNLGSLHNWITTNFFNGNMPLGVTVVYHIIVYELIMDIIFLIYAVFMFIVDFASDFLEHCFTWSRRGGN